MTPFIVVWVRVPARVRLYSGEVMGDVLMFHPAPEIRTATLGTVALALSSLPVCVFSVADGTDESADPVPKRVTFR
jgi:hypothetical protein